MNENLKFLCWYCDKTREAHLASYTRTKLGWHHLFQLEPNFVIHSNNFHIPTSEATPNKTLKKNYEKNNIKQKQNKKEGKTRFKSLQWNVDQGCKKCHDRGPKKNKVFVTFPKVVEMTLDKMHVRLTPACKYTIQLLLA